MLVKIAIILLIAQQIDAKHNRTCLDLLRHLGAFEGDFVHCITTHSVPVTMCTSCKVEYDSVNEAYSALKGNKTCASKYFDEDRVNIVASTETALNGLWTKAFCADCNEKNTLEFDNKSTAFEDCLRSHKNDECTSCMEQYLSLNNFYKTLDKNNNGKVCFDIQDSMNRTRNTWSKGLKCCRREFRMTLFTVALCIVTCLPFLFYSGTYLVTKRQERNHGTLNDEDPLFSSSGPSIANSNIHTEEVPSSSRQRVNHQSESTKQAGFIALDEDEDSDEENLAMKNKLQ